MGKIDDRLLRSFRDEDTEVWMEASVAMGKLGDAVNETLQSCLGTSSNIHAHRHAWCVLASYLDTIGCQAQPIFALVVGRDKRGADIVEEVEVMSWLGLWLSEIVLTGLAGTDVTLGKLESLFGFREKRTGIIEDIRGQLEKKRSVAKERGKGSPKALKGIQGAINGLSQDLSLWQKDETSLRLLTSHKPRSRLPWDPWVFSSFVAGATPDLLHQLGIPLSLFVKALVNLASQGGGQWAYVANLPRLLSDLPNSGAERADIADLLLASVPEPGDEPMHWVDYLGQLRGLLAKWEVQRPLLLSSTFRENPKPSGLREALLTWEQTQGERESIDLIRIAESQLCGRTRWREKTDSERLALAVFLAVLHSPTGSSNRWKTLSLSHRIQIVRESIERLKNENPDILVGLVRLLKVLLYEELRSVPADRPPHETCRRHIYYIQPLVEQWNLRGTITKDLATIAVRALVRCSDYCHREKTGDEEYRQLLYTVLYALSERSIIAEMRQYAQNDAVRCHLESLSDFVEAVDGHSPFETKQKELRTFLAAVWQGDSLGEHATRLVSILGRSNPCETFGPMERRALSWMISLRERWHVQAMADFPQRISESCEREMLREVSVRTDSLVGRTDSLIQDLARLERSLCDVDDNPDAVVQAMQAALEQTRSLKRLCRGLLPFAEREVVCDQLDLRSEEMEERITVLTRVIEEQDEALAKRIVSQETEEGCDMDDRGLVVNWMLRRHMLRELAGGNVVLEKLLDLRWVIAWMLSPFLLSGVLHAMAVRHHSWAGSEWIWGLPFVLIIPANLLVLVSYRCLPARLPGGFGRASLLLPQMVGSLFLGIMQSFAADESWSLAFFGHPIVRLVKLAMFFGASYFFLRYVMLQGQSPAVHGVGNERVGRERRRMLRKRALDLLSLGLWQAFALVTLFTLLQGTTMGGPMRADLVGATKMDMDALSIAMGSAIPHRIDVSFGILGLRFLVFPWAIFSWTIQLFFFSAIFERIMSARKD